MKIEDVEKTKIDIETLATQQGVTSVENFDKLLGDFWPENEKADEFISAVREWRREGENQGSSR
jgi:hypothetical protein